MTAGQKSFEFRQITASHRSIPARQKKAGRRGRLLCFGHVIPHNPPRAGNELRIQQLLAWLMAEGWDVMLAVCPVTGHQPSEGEMVAASRMYPNLVVQCQDGVIWYAGESCGSAIQTYVGQHPSEISLALSDDAEWQRAICPDSFVELVRHLDSAWQPDIHLAQYVTQARVFPVLRTSPLKLIDTMDAFSTFRKQYEPHGFPFLDISEEEEGRLLKRADAIIAIHAEDAALFSRLVPDAQVVTVGLDIAVASRSGILPEQPAVLLVAYDNALNVRGLRDFLAFAWPRIRQSVPGAVLRIAGMVGHSVADPPEGVHVLGFIENLAEEYRGARVAINPTFAGTGLKIKTLEALSHLRPVVAWPAGVDGIGADFLPFCRVASDWAEFADQVVTLLRDSSVHTALEKRRHILARTMSAKSVYRPLRHALAEFYWPNKRPSLSGRLWTDLFGRRAAAGVSGRRRRSS
jgi:glycosyltransferase involved in cell wall biosynthesis